MVTEKLEHFIVFKQDKIIFSKGLKVWTNLDKLGQVWTSLDKLGQVWTSLDKIGSKFSPEIF